MADIITKDSEEFKELTGWIKRTGKNLEAAAARIRPTIADEHYLSGDEVCRMLHVSKRTLQTLRDEKAIPYTSITSVGGKLLYPESGLYEVLKKNYKDFRPRGPGDTCLNTKNTLQHLLKGVFSYLF